MRKGRTTGLRMRRHGLKGIAPVALASLLVLANLAACSSEGKKDTLKQYPEFELADPAGSCTLEAEQIVGCAYGFEAGGLLVGGTVGKVFRIVNTGSRTLEISDITLATSEGKAPSEPFPFKFHVTDPEDQATLEAGNSLFIAPSGQAGDIPTELNVTFEFEKLDEDMTHTALVSFHTDAANAAGGVIELTLSTLGGAPRIAVSPESIKFERVASGESREERLTVLNTGSQDLLVTSFQFTGATPFALILQGQEYPLSAETVAGIELEEPLLIGPQKSADMKVKFTPTSNDPATASLILFSNDPTSTEGLLVPISGNQGLPCLTISPDRADFGGSVIGQISKTTLLMGPCEGSDVPVTLTGLRIKEGEGLSDAFDIDLSQLDHAPSVAEPLIIPVGTTVPVIVSYFPAAALPPLEDGSPAAEEGILIVDNDSFEPEVEVPLKGFPVKQICPTAVIKVAEGGDVIPQTVLHLYGSQSYAPTGSISKYEWSVVQPDLSASVFNPSMSYPDPTFEANVAGIYVFHLDVWDSSGVKSCEPGEYEVLVTPDKAIHVELLWHTPMDSDETDTGSDMGSDLDLHFAHPSANMPDEDGDGAPDPWFDSIFDCYWFNPHPDWASFTPSVDDDPNLDRDDTDGAGPENLNLAIPENLTYKIGTHYWDDHGYGSSVATVRVYIYGFLVMELNCELVRDDMWYAATVEWPSGKVTAIPGGSGTCSITADYPNPFAW